MFKSNKTKTHLSLTTTPSPGRDLAISLRVIGSNNRTPPTAKPTLAITAGKKPLNHPCVDKHVRASEMPNHRDIIEEGGAKWGNNGLGETRKVPTVLNTCISEPSQGCS